MDLTLLTVLVIFSGLFSGLNIGLLSLSPTELKLEEKLGNQYAVAILPIREQRNYLISTLILGNVVVNAIIPLFLNSLTTGLWAGLISIVLITLFGEILPQAVCAKHAILIGGIFAPFVRLCMWLSYPFSKPLALILDWALGPEKNEYYSKMKMERFVELHVDPSSNIDKDEIRLIKGSLTFSDKTVKKIMTPWKDVFALRTDVVIDRKLRKKIHTEGFSRIPIIKHNKNQICGILLVKDLIVAPPRQQAQVLMRTDRLFFVDEDETLDDLLAIAIQHHLHLFIVRNTKNQTLGLVSLEDIVEEILRQEIEDETD